MSSLQIGDIVTRKSYGMDIIFKVVDIIESNNVRYAILKGLDIRIKADAPESDLQIVDNNDIANYQNRLSNLLDKTAERSLSSYPRSHYNNSNRYMLNRAESTTNSDNTFKRPGTILHLDGDKDYVGQCDKHYSKVGVTAIVKYVSEEKQASLLYDLLDEYKPDILVLTGHDGMVKDHQDLKSIASYRNSQYFINSVKEARRFEPNMDNLVIYAGACQSHYEAIINAGANFASSPSRVFINVFDPVIIAEQIALTPIDRIISVDAIIRQTTKGYSGVGGLQTNGKYREGAPKLIY